jgi:bifunctional non-homologous end joining protein LigD
MSAVDAGDRETCEAGVSAERLVQLRQCTAKTRVAKAVVRRVTWEQAKDFAFGVAKQVESRSPREFTTNVSLAARRGKIYIDYLRNRRGATAIAPYSSRARPGAPVAVLLDWEELGTLRSGAACSIRTLSNRLRALKHCPWAGLNAVRQVLRT